HRWRSLRHPTRVAGMPPEIRGVAAHARGPGRADEFAAQFGANPLAHDNRHTSRLCWPTMPGPYRCCSWLSRAGYAARAFATPTVTPGGLAYLWRRLHCDPASGA